MGKSRRELVEVTLSPLVRAATALGMGAAATRALPTRAKVAKEVKTRKCIAAIYKANTGAIS